MIWRGAVAFDMVGALRLAAAQNNLAVGPGLFSGRTAAGGASTLIYR
jgi:hypothetical protein